jgi:hypothetical protein
MAREDFDIRAAASIPGRPTMLDHVLLVAMTCGIDQELEALAEWIYDAHRGYQAQRASATVIQRSLQRGSQH